MPAFAITDVEWGGGAVDAPPPPRIPMIVLAAAVFFAALAGVFSGVPLSSPATIIPICVLILAVGLPHGTLDVELLHRQSLVPTVSRRYLIGGYIGLALLTYLLWSATPTAGLITFFIISVFHFAEDWRGGGSNLLAQMVALATLSSPVIFHRAEIELLFVALTATPLAAHFADGLILIAPLAVASAAASCVALWQQGRCARAVSAMIAVTAMTVLPPLVGFALYFCLLHSPVHLADSMSRVLAATRGRYRVVRTSAIIAAVMLLTAATTVLLFARIAPIDLPDRLFRTTFMMLSVLTVPHMMMPMLVRRMGAAAKCGAVLSVDTSAETPRLVCA